MVRRWRLAVAGGVVLSGLVGCTNTPKAPTAPTPPPGLGKNTVFVPEPADPEKKEGPLSSATVLTFANAMVDGVAKDPNRPAADREATLARARQLYQEVLQKEPKNVDALLGLGDLYQVAGEAERVKEAEAKATATHPTNARVWAWVAQHRGQAKEFDKAAEAYHKAAQLDPEDRMYRKQLGFTLARGKRYEEGYEWLSRCMKEAEARYFLALMMIHNGDRDRAQSELQLALRADPTFQPAGEKLTALATGDSNVTTVGHQEFGQRN